MIESIPYHHYLIYRNSVHSWMPTDSHDRWIEHCNDVTGREVLGAHGWLPEQEITYSFNSHGFRSPEFNDSPSVLCLGCSFTMGIGLPLQQTWPSILQKIIGKTCWNLGLGGSSLDTAFRFAEYYVKHLNITAVVCLIPEPKRFEVFSNGQPCNMNQNYGSAWTEFYKCWISDDKNAQINQTKNLLAIAKICDTFNITFRYLRADEEMKLSQQRSLARDLSHSGYLEHRACAEKFGNMLFADGHK
jgi:prepilin-type processing-associated H-X9-DG protein